MIRLPRSTFYDRTQPQAPGLSDEQIVEQIDAIQDELSYRITAIAVSPAHYRRRATV